MEPADSSLSLTVTSEIPSPSPRDSGISLVQQRPAGLVPFLSYVHTVETTYTASVVVSILGIVTNSISLKTFLAMGDVFKDGVSLTFFMLTLSDLSMCCMTFCWSVCALCNFVEHHVNRFYRPPPPTSIHYDAAGSSRQLFAFPVDMSMVAVYSYIASTVFSMTTTLITTHLAVMRCLCVARPLTFRGSMSPGKTAFIFAGFFSFALVVRVPTLALSEVKVMFNPRLNMSRPNMWTHPSRELVKDITWSAVDIPIPVVAEVTLTVCVIVMARALKASANFRNKLASGVTGTNGNTDKKGSEKSSPSDKTQTSESASGDSTPGKLSTKDARIIKQLVFISVLFLCCNVPKLIRIVLDTTEAEFSIFGRYRFLFAIMFTIQVVFEILNSSLNFFIYFKFNSRFRENCVEVCSC